MKHKLSIFIFMILLTIPTLSFAAYSVNSEEFRHIIGQLDMQGHADHELSTCSVKKVYYEEVVDMLNDGQSEKDIIGSYVNEYGQAALRTPGHDFAGILAWVMPAVGLVVGVFVITIWMKKITLNRSQTEEDTLVWQSDTEHEIFEKTMDEERRKFF
jgi:cytochrome c-type biogenesis protein CcmH